MDYLRLAFIPLEIYNHAANYALYTLKCSYLYDEIEAEANLCLDQLIYKISQTMYSSAKIMASK